MTSEQAKRVLALYRPGTSDGQDPAFAEALELTRRDPELNRWFQDQCQVYSAIRAKLKAARVPEGLKEQILAERKVNLPGFWRRRPVWLPAGALALAVGVITAVLYLQPRDDTSFWAFQDRETHVAMRGDLYGMDVRTNNLRVIQAYLAAQRAPIGYVLPAGLAKAAAAGHVTATGCAIPKWRGHPVTMICFKTGRPLPLGSSSDLWLFVADARTMTHPPTDLTITSLASANPVTMAAWTVGDKVYVLSAMGDADYLKQYL